jgi:hypothetical protein
VKPFVCPECAKGFKKDIGLADHHRVVHGMISSAVSPLLVHADPVCIECNGTAKLVNGDAIYPHRHDLYHKRFWLCDCGAYCGCHGVTTRALGNPCGAETRRARIAAHDQFDPIWRNGSGTRRDAYTWLAGEMGIPSERCHIGMMTAAQAWEVVTHCCALQERRAA